MNRILRNEEEDDFPVGEHDTEHSGRVSLRGKGKRPGW